MSTERIAHQVTVVVPGTRRYVRLARLVAGGFATAHSDSMELVDDARIATGEICATLIETSHGGPVTLTFTVEQDAVLIQGSVEDASDQDMDSHRLAISQRILDVLSDRHKFARVDNQGILTVVLLLPQPTQVWP